MSKKQNKKLLTGEILKQAFIGSVKKLDPRYMIKNPVMFVVETGFFITLLLTIMPGLFGEGDTGLRTYNLIVSIILLITVLFANFAESVAEGRGKAQAASLKKTQKDRERKAAERIYGLLPSDQGERLKALWEEFEAYETPEAKFAHLLDNFQPILLNDASGGKSWVEHGVHKSQPMKRNERIPGTSDIIWEKMQEIFEKHVENGNLKAD